MKKLATFVFAMLLTCSLSFAETGSKTGKGTSYSGGKKSQNAYEVYMTVEGTKNPPNPPKVGKKSNKSASSSTSTPLPK